jgi:hypothetical protein
MASCPWPKDVVRSQSVLAVNLIPFQAWFRQNEQAAIIQKTPLSYIYTFSHSKIEFLRASENILEVRINNRTSDQFYIEYQPAVKIKNHDFVKFNFPMIQKGQKLYISHLQTQRRIEMDFTDPLLNRTTAFFPKRFLIANMLDYMGEDRVYSRIWYQCKTCTGDPVVMLANAPHCDLRYFQGINENEVNPTDYFRRLGGYAGGFFATLSEIINLSQWPKGN